MVKQKSIRKRVGALILAGTVLLSITGCGSKEEAASKDVKEFIYVPEYITMDNTENANLYNMQVKGDSVYYTNYSYDEATMSSTQTICSYSLTEQGEPTVLPYKIDGQKSLNYFSIDDEGNLYLLVNDYSQQSGEPSFDADGNYISQDIYLIQKVDAQGNLVWEKDISKELQQDTEHTYINSLFVDGEGRFYLTSSDWILLYNADGDYQGNIDLNDSWINNMGCGKDGKIYVTYYDQNSTTGGYVLAELDFAGKKVGTTYANFPGGNGNSLTPGIEKDFLVISSNSLLEYDLATQTSEEVLNWLDSDINGSYVQSVAALEDGRLLAVVNDWNTGSTEFAKLTKTKSSDIPQKEQITIGILYTDQNIQSAAVAFNKSSDQYHVNIQTYIDENNWTETSYQDGITKMNNDLTSGANAPDIVDLSQVNAEQFAAKGVFEDLTPYLEKSTVIAKEDFLENVIDSFTFDGRLVGIPNSFSISTIVGASSKVGDEMGWSVADLIAFAEKYPDKELLSGMTKAQMLNTIMIYNQNTFVDWEKGECSFDSQDFKDLLSFVNKFPEEYDWSEDSPSSAAAIQAGDVLLESIYISQIQDIQVYPAMYEEPITCIGYPTFDGSVGCMMQASSAYAITSKSKNKDGAWAFVESFLSQDTSSDRNFWGFPTRKAQLDKLFEDELKVEYVTDENGEPILDENGEPMIEGSGSGIGYGDWEYTFHHTTEEEAALVRSLIDVAKPVNYNGSEILTIILEEAEPFFQGQKSVDDVAGIIQSRLQIYVSENS